MFASQLKTVPKIKSYSAKRTTVRLVNITSLIFRSTCYTYIVYYIRLQHWNKNSVFIVVEQPLWAVGFKRTSNILYSWLLSPVLHLMHFMSAIQVITIQFAAHVKNYIMTSLPGHLDFVIKWSIKLIITTMLMNRPAYN